MNRLDPNWTDHVVSQMTTDEKVVKDDGKEYAKIAGLRRMARLLMGPFYGKNGNPVPVAGGVAITHTLTCYLREDVIKGENLPYPIEEWSGSADCTQENGGGARDYATAFADTRAEARALVRLLGLTRCSAEEFGGKSSKKSNDDVSKPSKPDRKVHDILCERLNIDQGKFYQVCGKKLFGKNWDSNEMTRDQNMKLSEVLNEFQQNPKDIPNTIKGNDNPF